MTQRETDEQVLDWIRQRASGKSSVDIAARYKVTDAKVRVATNRVFSADNKESGEEVWRAYW